MISQSTMVWVTSDDGSDDVLIWVFMHILRMCVGVLGTMWRQTKIFLASHRLSAYSSWGTAQLGKPYKYHIYQIKFEDSCCNVEVKFTYMHLISETHLIFLQKGYLSIVCVLQWCYKVFHFLLFIIPNVTIATCDKYCGGGMILPCIVIISHYTINYLMAQT